MPTVADQDPVDVSTLAPATEVSFTNLPDATTRDADGSDLASAPQDVQSPKVDDGDSSPPSDATVVQPAVTQAAQGSAAAPQFVTQPTGAELDQAFAGATDSNVVSPPDTQVAVSGSRVVEFINNEVAVYDRSGNELGKPKQIGALFQSGLPYPGPNGKTLVWRSVSDPKVLFDASLGRFVASEMVFDSKANDGAVKVAISDTADPTGKWKVGVVNYTTNHELMDQPKLAVDANMIILTDDLCHRSCDAGGQIIAVDKAALADDGVVTRAVFKTAYGAAPAIDLTFSQTSAFVYHYNKSHGKSYLEEEIITGSVRDGSVRVHVAPGVRIAKTSSPPNGRQPAASRKGPQIRVDTGDDKVESAVFRDGIVWLTSGDACKPAGDKTTRACARIIEVLPPYNSLAAPELVQDVDETQPGVDSYYPAVTMDIDDDVIISYSVSSPTMYPQAAEMSIANSGIIGGFSMTYGYATPNATLTCSKCGNTVRFGDYSGAAPDPDSPSSVWIAAETAPTNGKASGDWRTVIAQFSFNAPIVYPDLATRAQQPSNRRLAAGSTEAAGQPMGHEGDTSPEPKPRR